MASPGKRILLVEDDIPLSELIADYLREKGLIVVIAMNGAQAIQYSHEQEFDLIVCDLMLPDTHGFKLVERICGDQHCPLIFLTAVSDDDTHIYGLELGAVDFIAKPVRPPVLLARINAQLRKQPVVEDAAIVELGDYKLDYRAKGLYQAGRSIALTNQEFDILWLFIKYSDSPISREFMFQQIVGRPYDGSDRAADLKISRLRRKLAQSGCNDLHIRTIRGRGYILSLDNHA